MLDVALLIGITGTEVETVFGGSACYTDIVVGDESGLEDLILPVGVARPWGKVEFWAAFIPQLLVVEFLESGRIGHCNLVRYGFETE